MAYQYLDLDPIPAYYYYWLRLSVDTCAFVVKDYSYSTIPLYAGEGAPAACDFPSETGIAYVTSTRVKFN